MTLVQILNDVGLVKTLKDFGQHILVETLRILVKIFEIFDQYL